MEVVEVLIHGITILAVGTLSQLLPLGYEVKLLPVLDFCMGSDYATR